MNDTAIAIPDVPGEPCKLIMAVLPDDGTDLVLMRALRAEKGVVRANSTSCLGSSVLAEARTKPGHLPEPILARMVQILVPESRAEEIFEFVWARANINQLLGGVVMQMPAPFCSSYELPGGVPDEAE